MNEGSKERQQNSANSTSFAEKIRLILNFCGRAYPKFGINLEWLLMKEISIIK